MATSSIFGGEHLPEPIAGRDTDALGPSDNSDSGSDAQGAYGDGELGSDSDAAGTGERASVEGMDSSDRDILPDHVIRDGQEGMRADIDDTGAVSDDADADTALDELDEDEDEDLDDAGDDAGVASDGDVDEFALDDDLDATDDGDATADR